MSRVTVAVAIGYPPTKNHIPVLIRGMDTQYSALTPLTSVDPFPLQVHVHPPLPPPFQSHTSNRSLGVRARDVSNLTQFIDPKSTTNPVSVLARAEAAWRKRRANGGVAYEAAIEAGELAIGRAKQARATAAAEVSP